jgi:hypothetical protein
MPEMDLHWPSEIGLHFVWSQIFAYMLWPHNAVKRRAHVIGDIALMLGKLDYPPYLRNHDWPNLSMMLDPTWTAGRDFAIENGRNAGG